MYNRYRTARISVAVTALCVLSACAAPTLKAIGTFSEKTAAAAVIVDSAAQLNADIQTKTNASRAAVELAKGRFVGFPPKPGTFLNGSKDEDLKARTELLDQIAKYAGALAEAADPALTEAVTDAASGLSLALSNFAAARAARVRDEHKRAIAAAEAQRVLALGNVIAAVGGYAVELGTAARIRSIMAETHPKLLIAAAHLRDDFDEILASTEGKREVLRVSLAEKLRVHARDGKLSSAEKYDLYLAATNELRGIDGRIEIAGTVGSLLDKMVKAHAELRDSTVSKEAFLAFISHVKAISGKIEEYQEIERKIAELRRA